MICCLGLGSNLGEREKNIDEAVKHLIMIPDTRLLIRSSNLETEPVGYLDQPDFINCVVKLETALSPEELLQAIAQIETQMGRKREIRWGPRNIDIDILFYGNEVIDLPHLVIPHKELHKRKFVLDSLLEIDPDFQHPIIKKTIKELREEL